MAQEKAKPEEKRPESIDEQDNTPPAEGDGEQKKGETTEAGAKKSGLLKWGLFIGGPVLLLLIVGAVLYFLGIFGTESSKSVPAHEQPLPIEEQLENIFVFKIPSMLINLRSTGKRTSFLKLTVSLEIKGEEEKDKKVMEELQPRIVDQFQTYLRQLEVEDLQGSAGLQKMREELLDRANAITRTIPVQNVLFAELLVQ